MRFILCPRADTFTKGPRENRSGGVTEVVQIDGYIATTPPGMEVFPDPDPAPCGWPEDVWTHPRWKEKAAEWHAKKAAEAEAESAPAAVAVE